MVKITDSILQRNGRSGIEQMEDTHAIIIGCSVKENVLDGVGLWGNARAKVARCSILRNHLSGILLANESSLELFHSEVSRNSLGVTIYTKSCGFPKGSQTFAGSVVGKGNYIYDNSREDLCPSYPSKPWPKGFLKEGT